MALGVHRLFRRRQAAWWTFVAGLAVTAALGWEMHREAVKMDRQRMAVRVAEVQAQLDARLEKSEMLLHNLRDYLTLSGENRNQIFARWCYENGLSINCPWLYGIAVATNRHQPQWRTHLPNPPETWTPEDWKAFYELARRQPIECEIALKSDVKDQTQFPPRYLLMRSLRDRDQLGSAIQTSRLKMSERKEKGVMWDANSNFVGRTLYYVPVYKPETADLLAVEGLTRSQQHWIRWMHLNSLVLAPVDFNALVRSVWDGSPSDLGMEIFSSTNQTAGTWLNISQGIPRAADPKFQAYLTHRQPWPMYGQLFSIFFYTTPLFEAQSLRRLAKIAMAAGTALTLLATALVSVASRARNRQERMTEQIREARDALAAAQREREKFSRDLHDGTIQSLYAVQLRLGHTVEKLETNPARAGRELSEVRRELDGVIAEIREFITPEPGEDKSVDLSGVLRALVQRARTGTTAQITLHCEPAAAESLTGKQAVQLANIAREALSNSLRHARPQQVAMALYAEQEAMILEVSDDGQGFDSNLSDRAGVGLTSMRARTQEMGGTLEIQSAPGKGTRVVVRVPVSPLERMEENGRTTQRVNRAT